MVEINDELKEKANEQKNEESSLTKNQVKQLNGKKKKEVDDKLYFFCSSHQFITITSHSVSVEI